MAQCTYLREANVSGVFLSNTVHACISPRCTIKTKLSTNTNLKGKPQVSKDHVKKFCTSNSKACPYK